MSIFVCVQLFMWIDRPAFLLCCQSGSVIQGSRHWAIMRRPLTHRNTGARRSFSIKNGAITAEKQKKKKSTLKTVKFKCVHRFLRWRVALLFTGRWSEVLSDEPFPLPVCHLSAQNARSLCANTYFRQTDTRLAKGVECTSIKIPFTPSPRAPGAN